MIAITIDGSKTTQESYNIKPKQNPVFFPDHMPILATLTTFFSRQKRRLARMAEKNTDDDNNNCCHNNFDQNFGNFDDN